MSSPRTARSLPRALVSAALLAVTGLAGAEAPARPSGAVAVSLAMPAGPAELVAPVEAVALAERAERVEQVEQVEQGLPGRAADDPTAPTAHQVQPRDRWAWPVPEPHQVIRGFDPPAVVWGAGHRGVDLGIGVGEVVRSPADGVVTFAGVVAGQEVLVVAHADGLRSTFQPVLASLAVGARVAKGEPVGVLTATPGHCAPASCLHWGVLRGSLYLDPLTLLRGPIVLLPLH